MQRPTILLIVHVFLPKYTFGTEIYTYTLAQGLKKRGYPVHLICCESYTYEGVEDILGIDDVYDGIDVHRLYFNIGKTENPVRSAYYNPAIENYLIKYISETKPDLVHVNHSTLISTAAITAPKKLGLPVVATATDFWYICPMGQLVRYDKSLCQGPSNPAKCLRCYTYGSEIGPHFRRILDPIPDPLLNLALHLCRHPWADRDWRTKLVRALLERPAWMRYILNSIDLIFSPSQFLRDLFVKNGVDPRKIRVSPHGIDASWAEDLPPKRPSDHLRFAFIGMIGWHKGPHILVQAFNRLPNPQGATLKLYGDCEHFADYFRDLQGLMEGNPRISYEGKFPHEKIGEVLSEVDVLVVPSMWYENTPIIMYEAFATKTPVIATNAGGMAELIGQFDGGWLFPRGDVDGLARTMQRLIDEPALVAEAGKRIKPVRRIEEHIADLERAYAEVLASRGGFS